MEYKIALIPGDGIGPEIVAEAKKVLDRVCEKYSHKFSYTEVLLGGASIDAHGVPLTEEAIAQAKASDAVLMGSIGGDAKTSPWYKLEPSKRPEAGLLAIRKALNLFANLRPAYLYNELRDACPLRDEIIGDGFDMIIVRELTGGLYFGARKTTEENGVRTAVDTLSYNENEIRRIAIKAVYNGPTQLSGAPVKASDLRAGAALVTAGLMADGQTEITNIEFILRGYLNIIEKLSDLGADIRLIED